MNKKTAVGFIGGDDRICFLVKKMKLKYPVKVMGVCDLNLLDSHEICKEPGEMFSSCGVIVLPVPVSRDNVTIFSKNQDFTLTLKSLIADKNKYGKKTFLGGLIPSDLKEEIEAAGHTVIDYFEDPIYTLKNAIATAEGALMLAMERLDRTVISSELVVVGCGRIGSYLSKILSALGGSVTVLARSKNALTEAASLGYKTFELKEKMSDEYIEDLSAILDSSDAVFNTVPHVIIKREIIEKMRNRPLYIELASYPYGIDSRDSRELDFDVLYAPALPGRYAPISAAEYIFEAIAPYLLIDG